MKFGIVPVKDLSKAKERLSPILTQVERKALAAAMLEDVLRAIGRAKLLDRILVVTLDERAIEMALQFGIEIIRETSQEGQSASVDFASRVCMEMGATSVLSIPEDAPLITPADIDAIAALAKPYPSAVFVPATGDLGTNAVLRTPPNAIPSRFGYDSFRKHIAEAELREIPYEILRLPRVALDIDEPADLMEFAREPSDTKAYRELVRMGILDRIFR